MKKAILVANRKGKDSNTNGNVLWLTMYELPREFKGKDGRTGLWYPKKDDAILIGCISQDKQPDDYANLVNVREGAVCMVHFGVNDFTNKTFISKVEVVKSTGNIPADILYKTN